MRSKERLEAFSKENNGLKLAEMDLINRGAGNLFGTTQHGFGDLQFADWANLELIGRAQETYKELPDSWEPLLANEADKNTKVPLAN